jgi:hypothetical protein
VSGRVRVGVVGLDFEYTLVLISMVVGCGLVLVIEERGSTPRTITWFTAMVVLCALLSFFLI